MLTPEELARIAVSDQLRRGLHGLVGRHHDADALQALAERLATEFDAWETKPVRTKDLATWSAKRDAITPADGEELPNDPDRPVSGAGNPWSIPLRVMRRGDRAQATVTLGAGLEGAPGRVHGGVVSAIFDDLCGFSMLMLEQKAYTASLTVRYHKGTPLHVPITFTTWFEGRDGRKLRFAGECVRDGEVLTSCEALFITIADHTPA